MSLCKDSKDSWVWKPSIFKEFSIKAFYLALEGLQSLRTSSSYVCLGLSFPKVEAFCWLIMEGKVSLVDNLRREDCLLINFPTLV